MTPSLKYRIHTKSHGECATCRWPTNGNDFCDHCHLCLDCCPCTFEDFTCVCGVETFTKDGVVSKHSHGHNTAWPCPASGLRVAPSAEEVNK